MSCRDLERGERVRERVCDRLGVLLSPRLLERRGVCFGDRERVRPLRDAARESRVRERGDRERERLRERVPERDRVR